MVFLSVLKFMVPIWLRIFHLPSIGFHWKYGTRHETPETSGLIQFIQQLRFRGTKSHGREDLESKFHSLGAKVEQETDRERTSLYVTVHKDNISKAFEAVSDLINNSTYNENQLEAEREAIYRNIIDLQKDMMECTLEAGFYTSFRDHQLGQPLRGVRENVANITSEKVREYVSKQHTGSNLIVTATGNVDHNQILDLTGNNFGGLSRTSAHHDNTHMPMFTPSLTFMRDDEMLNLNCSIFFRAPRYNHPDSVMMNLLVEILGEYRADLHTGTNLNDPSRQYNTLHEQLGHYPDVTLQKTFFFPYSDVGLFGTYIMGNEVYGPVLLFKTQSVFTHYALEVIDLLTIVLPS